MDEYKQWYIKIAEELEITTDLPPHYDFIVKAATDADATPNEIALAEWLLDG